MLPNTGNLLDLDLEITAMPSRTYQIKEGRITGTVDGLEAVKQAVLCILNTERYEWLIYSWNHGVELKRLYGKPMGYAKSELKRRIKEALTQDDRIESVDAFSFEVSGRKLSASFTIHTIFGDIEEKKEVNL